MRLAAFFMFMNTFIYGITDPQTEQVHYIGKSNNPSKRLSNHIFDIKRLKSNPLSDWIQELLNQDTRPGLIILEEVTQDEWEGKERHYISLFTGLGHPLKNRTEGGNVFGKEVHLRAVKQSMKPVLQYTLEGDFVQEWESIRAAARGMKLAKSSIYTSLNTNHQTAGGFVWRFKKKTEPIKIKIEKEEYKRTYKPIIQILEDGSELRWRSIKHAAEGLSIPRHNVTDSLKRGGKVRGYFFKKDLSDPIWNHKHGKLNKIRKKYHMHILP